MNIILTKQYSLRNQPFAKLFGMTIGLIDSDHQARSFYQQKMQEVHMDVLPFVDYSEAEQNGSLHQCHAVVFGLQADNIDKQLKHLALCITKFPSVPVVTIAKTVQEKQIDAIMKLGTRLHINRDFSHPRDLIVALEQIL